MQKRNAKLLQQFQEVRGNILVCCRPRPISIRSVSVVNGGNNNTDEIISSHSNGSVGGGGGSSGSTIGSANSSSSTTNGSGSNSTTNVVGGGSVSGDSNVCLAVKDDSELQVFDKRAGQWKSFVFDKVWSLQSTQVK